MPLDPFDLGLEDVSKYPTCAACRKKSDGGRDLHGFTLCGTHWDEAVAELTRTGLKTDRTRRDYVKGYVHRLRTTRYAACWAAKEEP